MSRIPEFVATSPKAFNRNPLPSPRAASMKDISQRNGRDTLAMVRARRRARDEIDFQQKQQQSEVEKEAVAAATALVRARQQARIAVDSLAPLNERKNNNQCHFDPPDIKNGREPLYAPTGGRQDLKSATQAVQRAIDSLGTKPAPKNSSRSLFSPKPHHEIEPDNLPMQRSSSKEGDKSSSQPGLSKNRSLTVSVGHLSTSTPKVTNLRRDRDVNQKDAQCKNKRIPPTPEGKSNAGLRRSFDRNLPLEKQRSEDVLLSNTYGTNVATKQIPPSPETTTAARKNAPHQTKSIAKVVDSVQCIDKSDIKKALKKAHISSSETHANVNVATSIVEQTDISSADKFRAMARTANEKVSEGFRKESSGEPVALLSNAICVDRNGSIERIFDSDSDADQREQHEHKSEAQEKDSMIAPIQELKSCLQKNAEQSILPVETHHGSLEPDYTVSEKKSRRNERTPPQRGDYNDRTERLSSGYGNYEESFHDSVEVHAQPPLQLKHIDASAGSHNESNTTSDVSVETDYGVLDVDSVVSTKASECIDRISLPEKQIGSDENTVQSTSVRPNHTIATIRIGDDTATAVSKDPCRVPDNSDCKASVDSQTNNAAERNHVVVNCLSRKMQSNSRVEQRAVEKHDESLTSGPIEMESSPTSMQVMYRGNAQHSNIKKKSPIGDTVKDGKMEHARTASRDTEIEDVVFQECGEHADGKLPFGKEACELGSAAVGAKAFEKRKDVLPTGTWNEVSSTMNRDSSPDCEQFQPRDGLSELSSAKETYCVGSPKDFAVLRTNSPSNLESQVEAVYSLLAGSQDDSNEKVAAFYDLIQFSFCYICDNEPTTSDIAEMFSHAEHIGVSFNVVDRFLETSQTYHHRRKGRQLSEGRPSATNLSLQVFLCGLKDHLDSDACDTSSPEREPRTISDKTEKTRAIVSKQVASNALKIAMTQSKTGEDAIEVEINDGYSSKEYVPSASDEPWWEVAGRLEGVTVDSELLAGTGSTLEPILSTNSAGNKIGALTTFAPFESRTGRRSRGRSRTQRMKLQTPISPLPVEHNVLASQSFSVPSGKNRMTKRQNMASYSSLLKWESAKAWSKLSSFGNPTPINAVAAVSLMSEESVRKRNCINLVFSRRYLKRSYKRRIESHDGFSGVDVYSLYTASVPRSSNHSMDDSPWESRSVKQRFLHEQSISLTRNWFGSLTTQNVNDVLHQPVCRPRSMEMPMQAEEWTEDWYQQLHPSTSPLAATFGTDGRYDRYFDDDESDEEWEDAPECGKLKNVRLKVGERISRVSPDLTSYLRRSRWRKRHFPNGSFPF